MTGTYPLLIIHSFAAWAMFGIIWVVQIVHYPAFRYIDPSQFTVFHQFHSNFITPIVGPLLLLELATGILLVTRESQQALYWINALGVVGMFVATFAISVPLHNKLIAGFDLATIDRLIWTNWIRTFIYTLRAPLLVYLCISKS